jgi:transcriptional regulator of nitric oxide reductase
MNELKETRISLGIHTIAGIAAGYVSQVLAATSKLYSIGAMLIILFAVGYFTELVLKKKGIKWWMSNGGLLYILVWLVSWIFIFNM